MLKAACDKGTCNGPPITAWDCSRHAAGTTILPKYLPAMLPLITAQADGNGPLRRPVFFGICS